MSKWARLKSKAGGQARPSLTAATTMYINQGDDEYNVAGTATVTSLTADTATRGRTIRLYVTSGALTLTNSPGTTTVGQMDLGALDPANVVLETSDSITLLLRSDGTWVRVVEQVNN